MVRRHPLSQRIGPEQLRVVEGPLLLREVAAEGFALLFARVGEAAVGLHFFMLAATWSLPLFIHDLWALARERQLAPVVWTESRLTGFRLAGVQAAGVGLLASLTLVLRSTTSLDFIYFAF